ncbi:hypothetical protein HA402_009226 [Bradysia odoriphaga]|nr:hypothetical protein HA402_009226 [Bradysia odoriphaga]
MLRMRKWQEYDESYLTYIMAMALRLLLIIITGIFANLTKRINKTSTSSGTKWCGPGNTASGYDDLGDLFLTDSCCRAHDHCDSLASGETKNNLTNNDFFTKLHCDCDKEFYLCLHDVNSTTSNQIGKIYFGLRNECYRNEYPIVKCVEYDMALFVRRCYRYLLDESKPKLYQCLFKNQIQCWITE